MTLSDEQKRDAIRKAIEAKFSGLAHAYWYVVATFDDHVVVCKDDKHYRVGYTIGDDGTASVTDEEQVRITYTPIAEGCVLGPLRLTEGAEPDGSRWACVLIEEGVTRNRTRYRRPVLEAAAPLYEGVAVYRNHVDPTLRKHEDKLGFISGVSRGIVEGVRGRQKFGLTAVYNVTDTAERARMLESYRLGDPNVCGLSHEIIPTKVSLVSTPEGAVRDVEGISLVEAMAAVAHPSAGGRVERLVAGNGAATGRSEEDFRMFERMLEALRRKRPDLVVAMGANPTEQQVREAYEGLLDSPAAPVPPTTPPPASPVVRESVAGIPAGESSRFLRELIVDKAFQGRSLPAKVAARVREGLMARPELTLEAATSEVQSWADSLAESVDGVRGSGLGIQMGAASEDKLLEGLDSFFAGGRTIKRTGGDPLKRTDTYAFEGAGSSAGFRSFREAYIQITGDAGMTQLVREQVGLPRFARLSEALDSSSWQQILGDSIRRAMLAEYSSPDKYLNDWRKIVSTITPVADFRTMRRMRMGGYGDLSTVAEAGPYEPFAASPGDEEATYSISKKGNTERISWEATVNDDVAAIRRIPGKLSRAAKRGLYKGVFDLLRTNATCSYDSTALAAVGHSNYSTTALGQSEVTTMRKSMAKIKDYGDNDELNLYPQTLVVPADLEEMAWRLTKLSNVVTSGQASTEQAFQRHAGPNEYIVVPYWTDTNNWWGVADPKDIPTIEVGFFQGREEPELLVQDDSRNGSMFSADVITLKIRFIWGVCILEHRGFYGAIVA